MFAGRALWLVDCDCSGEDPLEAAVTDSGNILAQHSRDRLVRPPDGGAQSGAGSPEEPELGRAVVFRAERIHLGCDHRYGQSVCIFQRHGESQKRELPGAQGLGVPFHFFPVGSPPAGSTS